jgi:lipoprotein-releasing system ATP-binding protein
MTVLEAKNIQKYFWVPEKFQALKDISFQMEKGEFVSIMGKSGCGKSTLLYVLSTMDTDYEGELWLNNELVSGQDRENLAAIRNEHIGFVFQFHYLLAEFSVLENVMLPAKKLGKKSLEEIEHDAMEKLKMLGIQDQAYNLLTAFPGDKNSESPLPGH